VFLVACGPGGGGATTEEPGASPAAVTTTTPSIVSTTATPSPTSTPTSTPATTPTATATSTSLPDPTTTPPVVPTSTTIATIAPPTTSTTPSIADQIDGGAVPEADAAADVAPLWLVATNAAFDRLASSASAASITVIRDGQPIMRKATGTTIGGDPVTSDTPMVVASVSKMLTAIGLSRLAQNGPLELDQPVPWAFLGLHPHTGWGGVTPRDLLGHAAGMPVVRTSWFTGEGSCAQYLPALIAGAPRGHRGTWTYSNGNYCALGLLVEFLTGEPLNDALDDLVFDPNDLSPARLSTDGQLPDEVGHRRGVARLSRLGGAGTLIVSTDSIAGALATLTPADRQSLHWPGGFIDQYGFGHTGTVGGAVACAWVLEGGRTVVAATISGERPATGGAVCDAIEPALGSDLGFWAGTPSRSSI
jgi:D-alanyl-D-alanine carboxypeptidase